MNHQYTSIDRIFAKLIRDVKSDFTEGDVIEWCGEALEFIGATRLYEEAIAFIEVKNHECNIPAGTHAIIQIARNNRWGGPTQSMCPAKIISELPIDEEPKPSIPVALDCNGEPINEYELAYYRPYFDLKWEYCMWTCCGTYRDHYTTVRLATNTFFNSIVCTLPDEDGGVYHRSGMDEYTIIQGKKLRFSFKEGFVAVSYLRQVLDEETGYPMIPDHISYTTAIVKYITMKMFEKEFFAGREGSERRMIKAEQDWTWYCKQAGNVEMMPNGIDEYQNLLDQRSYILPRQNRYYGFFGKMARPETRKYNDPDIRNWKGYYFRGN